MTSATDADLIRSLKYTTKQLNRYGSSSIFIFGVVGNILNCLVLSQRTLRSNPCALLFLVSSFVDLISILIGLPSRILAGWDLDPTATIDSLCKLRAFIVFSTRTMATWLITLATIDRWLLSCVDIHRRQMSTVKNVRRSIIVTLLLSALSYIHMFYCYEANRVDTPLQCYGKTRECRFATDLIYALITIAFPLILMVVFGLMTITNVRHVHTRVHFATALSINTPLRTKDLKFKKTDHHLLRMLLVQILFLVLLCVPQVIQKFHVTFKPFGTQSKLDDAIRHFLYNITLLLAFIGSGMPFYIYTLAGGSVFRKTFFNLIRLVIQKMTRSCQS